MNLPELHLLHPASMNAHEISMNLGLSRIIQMNADLNRLEQEIEELTLQLDYEAIGPKAHKELHIRISALFQQQTLLTAQMTKLADQLPPIRAFA